MVVKCPRAMKGEAVKGKTAMKAMMPPMMAAMVAEVVTEMVTVMTRPGGCWDRHERAGNQDEDGRTRKYQSAGHGLSPLNTVAPMHYPTFD